MHVQLGQIAPHTVQHNFSKHVLFSCFSQLNAASLHNSRSHMVGMGITWQDLTQRRRDCKTAFITILCIQNERKTMMLKVPSHRNGNYFMTVKTLALQMLHKRLVVL